ncbi:hypothetical protein ASU33_09180 [Solirubrum puertoriconensis]|uniref:Uncharacterized protein n=2 Tax=Solirubrum puertoriconensis TaxID=1751427 RepID=A0A9X0HLV7_SOLP1|nr:hypothetical protein ASU33_09180 [Solirubrum puertoriconensis]
MLGEHIALTLLGLPLMLFQPLAGDWIFYCLLALYLNKDFLLGRSPLKRAIGTQVQTASGLPANEWQSFLRNTTVLAWPLEVLAVVITGQKRLGDYIARTQVVNVERNAGSWRQELAAHRVSIHTLYALLATALYLLLVHSLFNWIGL